MNKATCYTSIWNNSSGHDFLEFIQFVTDGSFTADGGLLQPTEGVNTTPQMTCFRGVKSVHKMATGKSEDELIQHDNKLRIWTRSGKFRKWKIQNYLWLGDKAQRERQRQQSMLA